MLPDFNERGFLPPGEHFAAWEEVRERFGGNPTRERLLAGLEKAIILLKAAECPRIWLDGSFVSTKSEPGDFDACFDRCDVALLDERLYPPFRLQRREQKRDFGGELFPAEITADVGVTGIPVSYRMFFQRHRTGEPKGIVVLEIGSWELKH
jgi:hypothetical protein